MASRKRSRGDDDVGEEEVEIESASSSFRMSSQHKRSRIAMAAERGGAAVSDDEDSLLGSIPEDESEFSFDRASVAPSDVVTEVPSDADEDDEEEQFKAARIMEKERKRQQNQINVASEKGVIEEVFCRNFMCHSKLRIKLGPLINFIIGHNGSGKSAVLTALTMCLGGKASSTNRAGNLKKLIKEGQDSASLAVKIRNRGDDAYKPELYGTSITVERHFNQAGTSGFKLKNDQDKTITTKRADLDDLLDFYAFQLDNPINVLTQDNARQFLSGSSASQKYKLFIRGTQLESLDHDYNLIEENIDSLGEKLATREDDVKHLKDKLDEAQQKRERVKAWRSMQDTIQKYTRMHAWAQVGEQEEYLRTLEQALAGVREHIADLEQQQTDAEGVLEGHTQALDAAENLLQRMTEGLQPFTDAVETAQDEFKANTERLKELASEERGLRDDVKANNREISRVEDEIQKETERLRAAEGDEYAARSLKLEELQADAERAHETYRQFQARLPELINAAKEKHQQAAAAREEHERKKIAVREAETALSQVQRSQGGRFDGYRDGTEKLVEKINKETRWRQKPVGPLGQHIRLLNIEWQRQIEKLLGASLEGFLVTNAYDKKILQELMRSCGVRPTVFIGSNTPIDTSANEPPEHVLTIQRALRFDNEWVRKTLVINHGIEQIALTPDSNSAKALIRDGTRYVRSAVAMHLTTRGLSFSLTRSGDDKVDPVAAYNGTPRMKTDKEEQIRAERARVETARREAHEAEVTKRELGDAALRADQAKTKLSKDIATKKLMYQQADDRVEDLKTEIDNNRPQQGRLEELKSQLEIAQGAKTVSDSAFTRTSATKQELGDNGKKLKAVLEQKKGELADEQIRVDKQKEQVDSRAISKREAAQYKDNIYNELQDNIRSAEAEQIKVDDNVKVVAEFTSEATKVSTRVEVENGLNSGSLDKKIGLLQKQLAQMQRDAGGTEEELVNAWKAAHTAHGTAFKQFKKQQALQSLLARTLQIRRRRWDHFRRLIALRARITFAYLLSERNFRGKVELDHKAKELEIMVEPDIARHSDTGRETTTLSGGEKSFSTICLLLSIWDAMGSPIRCLDEFDVFMDSVNRKASMDLMIQAARRAVGRQFILITPQNMNNVEIGEDVKIHKMSDPERGQTALPY